MINEFAGRTIQTVVLSNENGEMSAPTMAGETWLNNNDLPRRSWTSYNGVKLFDIFMIVMLAVFFDVVSAFFLEKNREWYFFQIRRLQLQIFSNRFVGKSKDDQVGKIEDKDQDAVEEAADSATQTSSWPNSLVVKNIAYYVPLTGPSKGDKNELQLLNGVTATFKRGRMTALMVSTDGSSSFARHCFQSDMCFPIRLKGTSGAGKQLSSKPYVHDDVSILCSRNITLPQVKQRF